MQKLSIAIGLGLLSFAFASYAFDMTQAKLLGCVVFLIYLWSSEALPLGVVSLLPLLLFPSLGIIGLKTVAPNYSKPIIFLFIGGFLLAIGMQKTRLHEIIAARLLSLFPKSATGVIYALAITSAALSAFLSNTTVTIMLMPIALFLTTNEKLKIRYLIATAYGASIGGILTPIGTPPNIILLGFLEDWKLPAPTFVEWMLYTAPVVFSMILFVPWLLSRSVKDERIDYRPSITHIFTKDQKILSFILSTLVIILLLNAGLKPLFGFAFDEKLLLLGAGLTLFLPNISILEWEDTKEMPYEVVFLFGAGFAIATAFIQTGLASALAGYFTAFAALPLYAILFFVALFVSFTTEVTSNTALTSIAVPIFYEFAKNHGLPEEIILFTATIAASYAFMLPIATPPNAIIFSSRIIKIKQMAKIGFFVNLFGVSVVTLVAIFFWSRVFG